MTSHAFVMTPGARGERSLGECPTRSIRLSRWEAAGWVGAVGQWLSEGGGEAAAELGRLRVALEDACWLARWKREEAIVELSLSDTAAILAFLVKTQAGELSAEATETVDSMIRSLKSIA
jgi:hypothetical protein